MNNYEKNMQNTIFLSKRLLINTIVIKKSFILIFLKKFFTKKLLAITLKLFTTFIKLIFFEKIFRRYEHYKIFFREISNIDFNL